MIFIGSVLQLYTMQPASSLIFISRVLQLYTMQPGSENIAYSGLKLISKPSLISALRFVNYLHIYTIAWHLMTQFLYALSILRKYSYLMSLTLIHFMVYSYFFTIKQTSKQKTL